MPSDGDSFLPRIQSVFYSVFDVRQGPKIVYQVPEGLIAVPHPGISFSISNSSVPQTPSSENGPFSPPPQLVNSRTSSQSSPIDYRATSRSIHSPHKRSSSSNRILFNFDDISKYVIPHSALCGRLVICSTQRHRIIGFPVELRGKYKRNYFRYNLCFVFERAADLSCYEPIVRKVSRVLTSCEEESGFLSSPQTSPNVHAILEQLYEDLNSYSETSIPIDQFNSIELKIFPFYPNPPAVKDWMVPLALINLSKRIEDNWDLTMVKVCRFIDGVNHVSRIAHLANCDLNLTRHAISHLLYYQVIMTVDIFQYSNMYTLRKSIQWLADEVNVREECGLYVTKPGRNIPDWPKLLHLYSRLKSGKTVFEWMEAHEVYKLGIDVRRFTSFGVIKGFLRRVHRWPILLPNATKPHTQTQTHAQPLDAFAPARQRADSFSGPSHHFPTFKPLDPSLSQLAQPKPLSLFRGRVPHTGPTVPTLGPDPATNAAATTKDPTTPNTPAVGRVRRESAAEKVLEQLRSRDLQKSGAAAPAASSPRTSWIHPKDEPTTVQESPTKAGHTESRSRRQSLVFPPNPPPSPNITKATVLPARRLFSRSPPTRVLVQPTGNLPNPYPQELLPLLDGEHHTDELGVRFEAGWPLLEQWLVAAGGGDGDGDFGKVSIIYM